MRFAAWGLALALVFAFFPGEPDHIAIVAAGALIGFQLGYLLEGDRAAPLRDSWRKVAAVLLGLAVALGIRILGKILLHQTGLEEQAADFFRYFLIALWVIWLAPRTFHVLRLDLSRAIEGSRSVR